MPIRFSPPRSVAIAALLILIAFFQTGEHKAQTYSCPFNAVCDDIISFTYSCQPRNCWYGEQTSCNIWTYICRNSQGNTFSATIGECTDYCMPGGDW